MRQFGAQRVSGKAILGVTGILFVLLCVFGGAGFLAIWKNMLGQSQASNTVTVYMAPTILPSNSLSGDAGDDFPKANTPTLPQTFPTLPPQVTVYPTAAIPPSNVDLEILFSQMSLEEKIGQMIMSGMPGRTADNQSAALIQRYYLGGIVYFSDNTQSPVQVLQLSQQLQSLAMATPRAVPLLIAVDHEGGRVFRFKSGLTHFPSPMALGAANRLELAYNVGAANALELRSVGINMSLGPVLDINDVPTNPVIGLRAFGGRVDLVTQVGRMYVIGLQDSGVMAVVKHFPGHGSTSVDSHTDLPVVNKPLEVLWANEFVPFANAIQSHVAGVMIGHIANLAVDPSGTPASLSPIFVQDLLRGKMGYGGVVMTDAMTMGAITEQYGQDEAAVRAVLAGCDVLTFTDPGYAIAAQRAILQAVHSGRISSERIDQSARRVLQLKASYGLFAMPVPSGGDVAYEIDLALARQVAQEAITSIGGALPVLTPGSPVLLITPDKMPSGSTVGDNLSMLGELLVQRGIGVNEWIYPIDDPDEINTIQEQALQAAPGYSQVVVVLYDARLRLANQGEHAQINLLEALLRSGIPLLVVAGSSPYDLALLPPGQAGLATFGLLDIQVDALANVLTGVAQPVGIMPVDAVK